MNKIGTVELNNPFLLAPLAGITDAPYRRICEDMGASLTYSEMVSAKGLYYNDKKTERLLTILEGEEKIAFQLFGHEPDFLAWAAKKLEDRKNLLIDINMGCPVPKVVKNGEGSSLLKNPDLVYDIVKEVVKVTKKPVTCKIRAGFTEDSINYLEVAEAIYEAGGAAVALHARTREAYYSGKANWGYIKDLKEHFPNKIVIGNGDVFTVKDAFRMMDETGCDYIMIARGALGNPFLFKALNRAYEAVKNTKRGFLLEYEEMLKNGEIAPLDISLEDKKKMILRHLYDEVELKGDGTAIKEIRKHIGWYFKGEKNSSKLRGEINQINSIKELEDRIKWL